MFDFIHVVCRGACTWNSLEWAQLGSATAAADFEFQLRTRCSPRVSVWSGSMHVAGPVATCSHACWRNRGAIDRSGALLTACFQCMRVQVRTCSWVHQHMFIVVAAIPRRYAAVVAISMRCACPSYDTAVERRESPGEQRSALRLEDEHRAHCEPVDQRSRLDVCMRACDQQRREASWDRRTSRSLGQHRRFGLTLSRRGPTPGRTMPGRAARAPLPCRPS